MDWCAHFSGPSNCGGMKEFAMVVPVCLAASGLLVYNLELRATYTGKVEEWR